MRFLAAAAMMWASATATLANPDVERLLDVMGLPAMLEAFSSEGESAGASLNDTFLNGQGGSVWADTVSRLYDPVRLDAELRSQVIDKLDPDVATQALLFFESDLGEKIIDLEVQARLAMLDERLEDAARSAPSASSDAISDFLTVRDLVERNTDTALSAQEAFFAGLSEADTQQGDAPDLEARRDGIRASSESWLRGYYALAHSPLSEDEVAVYTAFWDTDVGRALDDALFDAFSESYVTLSFALGQAAGRLLPQNEL